MADLFTFDLSVYKLYCVKFVIFSMQIYYIILIIIYIYINNYIFILTSPISFKLRMFDFFSNACITFFRKALFVQEVK